MTPLVAETATASAWPVAAAHITEVLDSTDANRYTGATHAKWHGGVAGGGVVRRARVLRSRGKKRILVTPNGKLHTNRTLTVRLPCYLAHDGVCVHIDSLRYKDILLRMKAIEQFFAKPDVHKYLRISEVDGGA